MNELAIIAGALFLLWLLRDKSYPLKLTIYDSNGDKAWSSWNDAISGIKLLYQNTEATIVEAIITNNAHNPISIIEKDSYGNTLTSIGILPGNIGRVLLGIGNFLYGQSSYAKSNIEILVVYKPELILQ